MSPFASLDRSYHVPHIAINGFSRIGRWRDNQTGKNLEMRSASQRYDECDHYSGCQFCWFKVTCQKQP
jgi:hypothetical protein